MKFECNFVACPMVGNVDFMLLDVLLTRLVFKYRKGNVNPYLTIRGLDNAGKTTILKRFNGEEINSISPTLGFNIKTLEHKG